MKEITQELLNSFRAPAFPGSFFLSFEGIEGAGKSTQIIKLKNYLEEKNFRVLVLREPGGTPFGEKMRQAILETKTEITPLAEAHLFASSRAQLLSEVVLKELAIPNTVIICDRYIDSSLVYQGHSRGLGVAEVLNIHNVFPLNLVPHLTFYLRINVETSEKRQKMRNAPKDYFESKGVDFYKKLVVGYDLMAELFPNRILKLDAEVTLEQMTMQIFEATNKLIGQSRSANQEEEL
ncbi:dTMP kinase [Bacteriovorax stolpii]|uniref:Thymidylate kinase n=1 Tax=Bacteriovorax stolpii TaxID=960 RepID=A0A2K9NS73_BACTC|nr:dTMP kinase [Bacteriovorax stolpii]AUN98370.1 dTMP kinase [Bacteriovorax stolpii]TDP51009.1 dTMP kinase [Bacteriovorax stolpii]